MCVLGDLGRTLVNCNPNCNPSPSPSGSQTMSTDADGWGAAARLFGTEDGREGVLSFIERREARFTGR